MELAPSSSWSARLQVLYSGSWDVFPGSTAYGQGSVSPYAIFDLSSRIEVGPGTLTIGIENLFDNYYFPVRSQYPAFDSSYTPGRGRNVNVSYALMW